MKNVDEDSEDEGKEEEDNNSEDEGKEEKDNDASENMSKDTKDEVEGRKNRAAYEDKPGVKKRKLQREQMAVGLNNSRDDAKDITRWKNVVMTPAVRKVVEKDLQEWNPSFSFMVCRILTIGGNIS